MLFSLRANLSRLANQGCVGISQPAIRADCKSFSSYGNRVLMAWLQMVEALFLRKLRKNVEVCLRSRNELSGSSAITWTRSSGARVDKRSVGFDWNAMVFSG